MRGYSVEASGHFDISANSEGIEPVRERRTLQDWWDMSKKHDVDRTVRRNSNVSPPSAKFKLLRPVKRSKKDRSAKKEAKYHKVETEETEALPRCQNRNLDRNRRPK